MLVMAVEVKLSAASGQVAGLYVIAQYVHGGLPTWTAVVLVFPNSSQNSWGCTQRAVLVDGCTVKSTSHPERLYHRAPATPFPSPQLPPMDAVSQGVLFVTE